MREAAFCSIAAEASLLMRAAAPCSIAAEALLLFIWATAFLPIAVAVWASIVPPVTSPIA